MKAFSRIWAEGGREKEQQFIILTLFLHFPLISFCPTVPSALCDLLVGLSEEIISEHGQCETDGRMMDLT